MEFQKNITFIGAGNMATALITGLIARRYDPHKIWATSPEVESLQKLAQQFRINTTTDNKAGASHADILVLAVKPNLLKTVTLELADIIHKKKLLVITIAAMIPIQHLEKWLHHPAAIIRCMPNMAALVQASATALYANRHTSDAEKKSAETILQAVGITVWLPSEDQMDAVTALSGNGPAYFFYLIEIMEKAAVALGLSKEVANTLTLQTALGAAKLVANASEDAYALRKKVTSPGGTTERALEILEQAKLPEVYLAAFTAACNRAKDIAKTYE